MSLVEKVVFIPQVVAFGGRVVLQAELFRCSVPHLLGELECLRSLPAELPGLEGIQEHPQEQDTFRSAGWWLWQAGPQARDSCPLSPWMMCVGPFPAE